jgi:hypothetical protein
LEFEFIPVKMVMMTASVFLVNLFCSLVPCEPNFGDPQVPSGKHDGRLKTRSHTVPGLTSDGYLDPPVVQTYSGAMEGYLMKIINGRRIYAFEGVPYAEAPVGHLRFQVKYTSKVSTIYKNQVLKISNKTIYFVLGALRTLFRKLRGKAYIKQRNQAHFVSNSTCSKSQE